MDWCELAMMWCSDVDVEYQELCGCEGDCTGCDFSVDIDGGVE